MPVSFVVATVRPVGPVTTSSVVKGSRRPLISYVGASDCGTAGAVGTSAGASAVRVNVETGCAAVAATGAGTAAPGFAATALGCAAGAGTAAAAEFGIARGGSAGVAGGA